MGGDVHTFVPSENERQAGCWLLPYVDHVILGSLTNTYRRHDIDPQIYLTQLLTSLQATPTSQISQWLPDEWKRRNLPPTGYRHTRWAAAGCYGQQKTRTR
jgi:hypothetical protein